ncbi:hypothetical protein NDU88_000540 [Pleurodeles waltl]|uniref:Secreted protein n=1 Tax=Pleurodeles waltl TaxID=8319 RepID=A0AAV7U597_PLEWA|nr:hypothetical protein NDU88_000540 [Pleurodeles waltl]
MRRAGLISLRRALHLISVLLEARSWSAVLLQIASGIQCPTTSVPLLSNAVSWNVLGLGDAIKRWRRSGVVRLQKTCSFVDCEDFEAENTGHWRHRYRILETSRHSTEELWC